MEKNQDEVTKDCLTRGIQASFHILPIVVQFTLLFVVEFSNSCLGNTEEHKSHYFLCVFDKDLMDQFEACEFSEEPLSTSDIFIDVSFQVSTKVRQSYPVSWSLQNGKVELECKLEDSEFYILDLLFWILIRDVKRDSL